MEKSWNFAQTISYVHDIWLWQPSSLHLQVHYFICIICIIICIIICLFLGIISRYYVLYCIFF